MRLGIDTEYECSCVDQLLNSNTPAQMQHQTNRSQKTTANVT